MGTMKEDVHPRRIKSTKILHLYLYRRDSTSIICYIHCTRRYFRITCTACFGVMYFIKRYLLFYSTFLVLLMGPTGCCKKGKVRPIPRHDNKEGE
jgi:hypothetical protein